MTRSERHTDPESQREYTLIPPKRREISRYLRRFERNGWETELAVAEIPTNPRTPVITLTISLCRDRETPDLDLPTDY